jgi:hypothetical protein
VCMVAIFSGTGWIPAKFLARTVASFPFAQSWE